MSVHSHPEINCPSCGSSIETAGQQADIVCPVCNGHFILVGHLCPICAKYHEQECAACEACGASLIRLCRHCHATNWTGDELCIACGEPIDMLSQVEAHASQTTTDRLDRQMLEAQGLKEVEAVASDKRMAELMAIEEARQAELKRQRAKKQQQERQMLIIVFAAVVLFLLTFFGYALLSGG